VLNLSLVQCAGVLNVTALTTFVQIVWHSPSRIGRVSDTLSRIGRVSDTPPAALGGCPTLSQPHWESVQQSLSRIGRLPAALGECPTLFQPHWESVQQSLSRIGRLPAALGECLTLSNTRMHARTHARTHAHTFNGPFSRTTQVNRYQKVIPIWIFKRQLKNFLFSTSIPVEGTHVFCA